MPRHLYWKKQPVLDHGFVALIDVMGDDYAVVQAARKSFDADVQEIRPQCAPINDHDRGTLRFMMRERHTSPFEMVELKFMVRIPMHVWRQMVRHRTANVNEHSTRYVEALEEMEQTLPGKWRLQSTSNKQGSDGFADADEIGELLSRKEEEFQRLATELYQFRLQQGIAKEQARKDLPLSTYTELYWKCDLHNILHFLRLRLAPDAQQEIRCYAEAIYEIVQQVCPETCAAFEDYVRQAETFNRMELRELRDLISKLPAEVINAMQQPEDMNKREWSQFQRKLAFTP